MALPPLELFSLKKRLPCCRAAFSFLPDHSRTTFPRTGPPFFTSRCCLSLLTSIQSQKARAKRRADVAQLVEQLIRNQQVSGSIPLVGSKENQDLSETRPKRKQVSKGRPRITQYEVLGHTNITQTGNFQPTRSPTPAGENTQGICFQCSPPKFSPAYPLFFFSIACDGTQWSA
jgi:hypothetical protein